MLKPLGDRILVKPVEAAARTVSGIFLPDSAKEKPQTGRVLAVGKGRISVNGEREPLDIKEDDEILYSKYGGTEIVVDNEDLLILREIDVLAVV